MKAAGKNTGCAPHPNAFYLGDPLENAFRPETARIPLLVGTVFGEFAAFNGFGLNKAQMSAAEAEGFAEKMLGKQTADALLPLFHAAYPERSAADLPFLDVLFREPTMRYIRRRRKPARCGAISSIRISPLRAAAPHGIVPISRLFSIILSWCLLPIFPA